MQQQYGVRLTRDAAEMSWDEYRDLLAGLSHDTPLGRVVAVRMETNRDRIANFSADERRIHSEYQRKRAAVRSESDIQRFYESMKGIFAGMAGGEGA